MAPEERMGNTIVVLPRDESVQARIVRARRDRGWTQAELGSALPEPVSHVAISDVERGKTHLTLDLVMDLARTLEVPVDWLLEPILEGV